MIICKTPHRISFVGGGSDFKEFFQFDDGKVISATIDKYMYVSMKKSYKDIHIKYSQYEHVSKVNQIKHPIIKEVLKFYKLNNVDISSFSDIPGGTGLGSSSAFTLSLINAANNIINNKSLSKKELARLACYIEIEKVKSNIGYQDQYSCCFGGLNEIKFTNKATITKPLHINKDALNRFNSNLILIDTGLQRSASEILTSQKQNMYKNIKKIQNMVKLCDNFKNELKNENYKSCGEIINESWRIKKTFSENITNKKIDYLINYLIKNGAYGCKLLGAGMGGFIMCLANSKSRKKIQENIKNIKIIKFKFENQGAQLFRV